MRSEEKLLSGWKQHLSIWSLMKYQMAGKIKTHGWPPLHQMMTLSLKAGELLTDFKMAGTRMRILRSSMRIYKGLAS